MTTVETPTDRGERFDGLGRVGRLAVPRPRPQARGVGRQLGFDALMLLVASAVVLATSEDVGLAQPNVAWLVGFDLTALAALAAGGAYRPRFSLRFLDDLGMIIGSCAFAAMAVTFARELVDPSDFAASAAIREWLFASAYLAAGRGGLQIAQASARRRRRAGDPTLIMGAGSVGTLVAERLLERPEFGLLPVGFFDENPLEGVDRVGLPVFGCETGGNGSPEKFIDCLERLFDEHGIRHVIVAFSRSDHSEELELMRRGEELGISVSVIPRLFERVPDRTRVERLGGIPLITVFPSFPKGWQFTLKYAMDRLISLVGMLVLSPLLVILAIAVLATLGRPILYRQSRVGVDGQIFDLFKFRTMRPPAPSVDTDLAEPSAATDGVAPGGVEGDDRRTPLGRMMRATSLDEFPQLINVLRGEMSLVGPRPERVAYARLFEQEIYRYAERHRVRSGITGWAQIHKLRGSTSLDDRVEWDNYYIENWSPWLDLKILMVTPIAAFRDRSE